MFLSSVWTWRRTAALTVAIAAALVAFSCGGDGAGDESDLTPGDVSVETPPTLADGADLTEDDLKRHGIYRIVPPGYAGSRNFIDSGGAVDPGVSSSDPGVVRTSPLYVEVGPIPSDLKLVSMDTFDGGLNTVVRQHYQSDDRIRGLEISRVRKGVDPIDIVTTLEPPPEFDAELFLKEGARLVVTTLGHVAGHEAIIFTPIDVFPIEFQTASVMFYQDGVNTSLIGHSLPVSLLLEIAEEIARAVDEAAATLINEILPAIKTYAGIQEWTIVGACSSDVAHDQSNIGGWCYTRPLVQSGKVKIGVAGTFSDFGYVLTLEQQPGGGYVVTKAVRPNAQP